MLNWRDPENPMAGGAERVSLAYLHGLVERGHEVAWFSHAFKGAVPEPRIDGVTIVRCGGHVSSIAAAMKWYRQQARFDLVIDQHHGLPWYAPWWCGTNCVSYLHEVLGPIWKAFYSWPWSSLGRMQERATFFLYRNVPFFTGSRVTRSLLFEFGVRDVAFLPHGTDVNAMPDLPDKELVPPFQLAVVSRLAPNKRIEHAIQVVRLLREKGYPCVLTVVGSGNEEDRLKQCVRQLELGEWVRFTGQLSEEEKNAELRRAHFLLHTSQREGWGLNVTEANAMGTPGAVYPVGGLVESTLDGRTGIVSAGESPQSLAERLAGAFDDPAGYARWRAAAWQFAKELHWDRLLPVACEWFERQAALPHGGGKRRSGKRSRLAR